MAILAALLSCAFLAGTPGVAAPATDGRGAHAGQPQRGAARALRLWLPQPLGPYAVGVRWDSVSDPTRIDATTGRPRRLPIRIWYPARRDRRRGPAAPYFSPVVQAFAEEALGLPAGLFDIDTHAVEDAPARGHVRGVILAQPGGGSLAAFHTGQLVDLASQGTSSSPATTPTTASSWRSPTAR